MTTPAVAWEAVRYLTIIPAIHWASHRLLWRFTGSLFARSVVLEFRPFVPPLMVLWLLAGSLAWGDPFHPVRLIVFIGFMVGWWRTRNDGDGDDRWKRRRRKVAAKARVALRAIVAAPART